MKYWIITILILLGLIKSLEAKAQISELELYKSAYNYLNDSIIKVNYADVKAFAKNCNECCVKGIKLRFKSKLQVANKFIENDRGFPLCDLLKKKYRTTESCVYLLGSGESELTNHVQDSLRVFWGPYKMKENSEISKSIKKLISKKKDGYQVFFSDIFQNTLAAEIKGFCLPYDETIWMGSSTSFYFIFDEMGNIQEIYSGKEIHYN
jgi:hypothetical protein